MLARGSRGLTAKGLAWYTLGAPRRPNPDVRSLRAFARLSRARGAAGDLSARASPASDLSSSSARRARDFVAPAVPSRFRGAAVSGLDRGVDDASAQQPARARPLAPRVAEFPSARAHGALDPWRAPRDAPDAAAAHIAAVAAPTSSPYTHYDARLARAPPPDDPPPPPPPPDDPPPDEEKRLYHFQVRGADAKRAMDPEKIRCMCHEVAVAAATRARNVHVRAAVVEAGAASNPARPDPDSLLDDFCVFSHTVMRDILAAKHNKLSFWGATHWCNSCDTVAKAIRQMTEADVGALLVMDRVSLDRDGSGDVDEDELRAAPESGAIKGIITERDYLRAVALGNVRRNTKVAEVMTDFEANPDALVSVTPDTSVLAAMEVMTEQRIRHIPCIAPPAPDGSRGAKMEGIVTIGDVVKALLSEEREEVQVCKDYINGVYD